MDHSERKHIDFYLISVIWKFFNARTSMSTQEFKCKQLIHCYCYSLNSVNMGKGALHNDLSNNLLNRITICKDVNNKDVNSSKTINFLR